MIPVLCDRHQRVVLWGCDISDCILSAELFYLDPQLPKSIKVSDRSGSHVHRVEIPQDLQGQMFPRKGQRLQLRIIDAI